MHRPATFATYFLGGFECSSHRRADGRRLDLLASTGHDRHAESDYATLAAVGIGTVRDGVRWHLIEHFPGHYDWSSFIPMLEAARRQGVQVVWDLCHYGWPDHLDIWTGAFVDRFAAFARAAAKLVREFGDDAPMFCPVNEISYWAWAGGEMGLFNPCARGRGGDLKRHLVRATIAAIHAIREAVPSARIVTAEPLIRVVDHSGRHLDAAKRMHDSQYEAAEMLLGVRDPELGGAPGLVDLMGLNYYPSNQWEVNGGTIGLGHHHYRPLRDLLHEAHRRLGISLFLAETGAEGTARAPWLHYVAAEVAAARTEGVPVEGICLYPVLDYKGWENGRACPVGLWGAPGHDGLRPIDEPLAAELRRQQALLSDG
jgi:beta-glucosidase/6-phospho-beta-glucosidase/beta-galactosidase